MKKKTTVELVEQSEKVSFYSISFQMDRTTEFERFLSKFEEEAEFNEDYQKILGALEIILDRLDKGFVTIEERTLKSIEDHVYLL